MVNETIIEKKWYQSKTIWFNLILLIAAIFELIQQQIISGSALTIISIVNIVLRVISTQGVKLFSDS